MKEERARAGSKDGRWREEGREREKEKEREETAEGKERDTSASA